MTTTKKVLLKASRDGSYLLPFTNNIPLDPAALKLDEAGNLTTVAVSGGAVDEIRLLPASGPDGSWLHHSETEQLVTPNDLTANETDLWSVSATGCSGEPYTVFDSEMSGTMLNAADPALDFVIRWHRKDGTKALINRLVIHSRINYDYQTGGDAPPKAFVFDGSQDGIEWMELARFHDIEWLAPRISVNKRPVAKEFLIDNRIPYMHYRVTFPAGALGFYGIEGIEGYETVTENSWREPVPATAASAGIMSASDKVSLTALENYLNLKNAYDNADFNAVNSPGVYWGKFVANQPLPEADGYYTVQVIPYSTTGNAIQLACHVNTKQMFFRYLNPAAQGVWKKLITDSDLATTASAGLMAASDKAKLDYYKAQSVFLNKKIDFNDYFTEASCRIAQSAHLNGPPELAGSYSGCLIVYSDHPFSAAALNGCVQQVFIQADYGRTWTRYYNTDSKEWRPWTRQASLRYFDLGTADFNNYVYGGSCFLNNATHRNGPLTGSYAGILEVSETYAGSYSIQTFRTFAGDQQFQRYYTRTSASFGNWIAVTRELENQLAARGLYPQISWRGVAVDLNDEMTGGSYFLNTAAHTNGPLVGNYAGYLRITNRGIYTFQEFIPYSSNDVYVRTIWSSDPASSSRKPWKKLVNTDDAFDYLKNTTDTRNTATTTDDYWRQFKFLGLKTKSAINLTQSTALYANVFGTAPWMDSSGGYAHELAFANDGLFHRIGTASNGWEAWNKVWTGRNLPEDNIRKAVRMSGHHLNHYGYLTQTPASASGKYMACFYFPIADNAKFIGKMVNLKFQIFNYGTTGIDGGVVEATAGFYVYTTGGTVPTLNNIFLHSGFISDTRYQIHVGYDTVNSRVVVGVLSNVLRTSGGTTTNWFYPMINLHNLEINGPTETVKEYLNSIITSEFKTYEWFVENCTMRSSSASTYNLHLLQQTASGTFSTTGGTGTWTKWGNLVKFTGFTRVNKTGTFITETYPFRISSVLAYNGQRRSGSGGDLNTMADMTVTERDVVITHNYDGAVTIGWSVFGMLVM